jgi:hypothetical protein
VCEPIIGSGGDGCGFCVASNAADEDGDVSERMDSNILGRRKEDHGVVWRWRIDRPDGHSFGHWGWGAWRRGGGGLDGVTEESNGVGVGALISGLATTPRASFLGYETGVRSIREFTRRGLF